MAETVCFGRYGGKSIQNRNCFGQIIDHRNQIVDYRNVIRSTTNTTFFEPPTALAPLCAYERSNGRQQPRLALHRLEQQQNRQRRRRTSIPSAAARTTVRTRRRLCLCAAGKVWRSRVSRPAACKPVSLYGYAAGGRIGPERKKERVQECIGGRGC